MGSPGKGRQRGHALETRCTSLGCKKGRSHDLSILKRLLEKDSVKLVCGSTESNRATGCFCNRGHSDRAAGETQNHSGSRDGGGGDRQTPAQLGFPPPWGRWVKENARQTSAKDRLDQESPSIARGICSPRSLRPLSPSHGVTARLGSTPTPRDPSLPPRGSLVGCISLQLHCKAEYRVASPHLTLPWLSKVSIDISMPCSRSDWVPHCWREGRGLLLPCMMETWP